ncbi:MAG: hypothetical protein H7Y13_14270 [Sphingobacteriaceae bacterium]|nr:hypothetical protein [Sphingobacteriaceae bacterium]
MNAKNLLFLLLLFISIKLQAQVLPGVSKEFAPAIVSRLNDVIYRVKIPASKQRAIAIFFKQQDSIFQIEIKNGLPVYKDQSSFELTAEKLNELTGASEADIYYSKSSISASKFNYALLYRAILNLSSKQMNDLVQKNLSIQQKYDASLEMQQLLSSLNPVQTTAFFKVISEKPALKWSQVDWLELKSFNLTKGLDSIKTCSRFYDYQFTRIKRKERLFSTNQKDSIAYFNTHDLTVVKPRLLLDILKSENYKIYFNLKNQIKLTQLVTKSWENVKSKGLTKGLDSVQVKQELYNYELRYALATERIVMEKSLKNIFARQDCFDSRPKVLIALEKATAGRIPNSEQF